MSIGKWLVVASIVCAAGSFGCGGCGDGEDEQSGTTVGKDAGTGHGQTDGDAGSTVPTSAACQRNSDCARGEECRNVRGSGRICTPECREDRDCCGDGSAACGRVCTEDGCVSASPETCNGLDDDRDGVVDNGFDLTTDELNCSRCGFDCTRALAHVKPGGTVCETGVCRIAEGGCADGFWDVNGSDADGCEHQCTVSNGGVEEPDSDDNNCDGATDEGFACAFGSERPCGLGTGICQEGVQRCQVNGTWTGCADAIGPQAETCNGLDDDCDGVADNSFDLTTDVANCGACGNDCRVMMPHSDASCADGECVFGECQTYHVDLNEDESDGCEYLCPVVPVLAEEACDARFLDENCDGEQNEGCDCIDGAERSCGITPAQHGVGICHYGRQVCADGTWGACAGQQAPLAVELCNGLDDDCDGTVPANEADADRDGYRVCANDCNDASRFVNSEAVELCDGIDQDCDGFTDEAPFFVGAPCRGIGACATAVGTIACVDPVTVQCSVDFGGSDFAGSTEIANGVDDDCDGSMDEGFACVAGTARTCGLTDPTRNNVGICRLGLQTCAANGTWGLCTGVVVPLMAETCNGLDDDCDGTVPANEADADRDGYRVCDDDCDDTNAAVRPGATDNCNGLDVNCDGIIDGDYFVGVPCRGVGVCGSGAYECATQSTVRCSVDIGGSAYTGVIETCNGLDDDCDGVVDNGGVCGQCTPGTSRTCGTSSVGACKYGTQTCQADRSWGGCVGMVVPLMAETCNGLDDDCDGTVPANEADADRDGYRVCAGDCDDVSRNVNPAARETCNGLDDDCDGDTDEDYFVGVPCRGVGACGIGAFECATTAKNRCSTDIGGSDYPTPAPLETCDRADNDCDGIVDLDASPSVIDDDSLNCGACGVACAVPNATTACAAGACTITGCATGFLLVGGTCLRCDVWPITAEACDVAVLDEDCDGQRNEGCACVNGTSQPCGLDSALHGVGICHRGAQTCVGGQWGACTGAATPSAEVCNGRDDNCDGLTPTGETDADGDGFAACEGDCDDTDGAIRTGVAEVCDGDDNDCDGTTDEGFSIGAPCNTGSLFGAACAGGTLECSANPTAPSHCSTSSGGSDYPTPAPTETCDNRTDDDCDGSVDEGCGECGPSAQRPCGIDPALHNVGICRVGIQTCTTGRTWGACSGATTPLPAETCNDLDDDCDGTTDEDFNFTSDPAYCGGCLGDCKFLQNVATANACVSGVCGGLICDPGFHNLDGIVGNGCEYECFASHNGVERCDGLDNDCDGEADEPPTCDPPSPNAPMTFSVTLPTGFPRDATAMFCSTFVNGLWSCGGYPLTVTVDAGTGAATFTTSGAAIAGNHVFGLCTAACNTAAGTWVVAADADGFVVEAAVPAVTYNGVAETTIPVPNGEDGGNWAASF